MARITAGKHASKKDVITHKAALLFRTRGFAVASMRELAEMLGVEAPSLYNHIGSKSELLQNICFSTANEFTLQLDEVENDTKAAAAKRIEQIIRFHIRMMLEKFDEVYVANHEWKYLPDPYLGNFLNQRRAYEKRLTGIIEEGIRKKELRPLNAYISVLTILSAVRGLEFWHRGSREVPAAVLESNMTDHLLKGLIK